MTTGKVQTQVSSASLRENFPFTYTALCVSGFDFRETDGCNYPTGTNIQHTNMKDEAFPLRTHEFNGREIL
jgi:hypothetical protein